MALKTEDADAWKRRQFELEKHIAQGRKWYEMSKAEQALILTYMDAHAEAMKHQYELTEWERQMTLSTNPPIKQLREEWGHIFTWEEKMHYAARRRRWAYLHIMRSIEESLGVRFDDDDRLEVVD